MPHLYRIGWYPEVQDSKDSDFRRGYIVAESEEEAIDKAEDDAFDVVCYPARDDLEPYVARLESKQIKEVYARHLKRKEKLREDMDKNEWILIALEECE